MKILYFSFVELDVPNACQTHTLGVLRGFSHHGCKVDALVPRPLYVRPKLPNVRFLYLWPWQFSPLGRKWVKFLSFSIMFFLCTRNKYNAIYVREMETNPAPRLCSKMFNIPLYMEINDLIVPVLLDNGLPSNWIHKARRNQKLDFQQATGLIVPSVPMRNWLIDQYTLPGNKVHMLLNGTDITNNNNPSRMQAKEELGLPPNCFCLGYVGNIYQGYDFNSLLQAIVECQDEIPHLYLVLIGDGPITSELKKNVNDSGLQKRIIFTGYVQFENLGRLLPAFDVGLLLRSQEGALRYGPVSTKLATYASFHLPVITAGLSLEGYPDELAQGLFLVPPENPHALTDMILWLCNHPEQRKAKARNLHDFVVKNLTWESITKEILDVIKHDKTLE